MAKILVVGIVIAIIFLVLAGTKSAAAAPHKHSHDHCSVTHFNTPHEELRVNLCNNDLLTLPMNPLPMRDVSFAPHHETQYNMSWAFELDFPFPFKVGCDATYVEAWNETKRVHSQNNSNNNNEDENRPNIIDPPLPLLLDGKASFTSPKRDLCGTVFTHPPPKPVFDNTTNTTTMVFMDEKQHDVGSNTTTRSLVSVHVHCTQNTTARPTGEGLAPYEEAGVYNTVKIEITQGEGTARFFLYTYDVHVETHIACPTYQWYDGNVEPKDNGLPTGAVVGICVASVTAVVLIGAVFKWKWGSSVARHASSYEPLK